MALYQNKNKKFTPTIKFYSLMRKVIFSAIYILFFAIGVSVSSAWSLNPYDEYDEILTNAASFECLRDFSEEEIYQEIEDLKDDEVKWNASGTSLLSIMRLNLFPIEKLTPYLDSDDHQQRQFIAHIIRRSNYSYHSDRLFEVLVESLRSDYINSDEPSVLFCAGGYFFLNAYMAFDDLLFNGSFAKKYLLEGLSSRCRQQKKFCAILLGENRIFEELDKTLNILCENLKDDGWMSNGCHAFAALYSYGPSISEKLVPYHTLGDTQSRLAIEVLWKEFGKNPKDINLENVEIGTTFGHTPVWSGDSLQYLINYNKNGHYKMYGSLNYYKN